MAKGPIGGRPNKAALLRIKMATVVVSIVAFVGSLGGVAYLHPGIATNASLIGQVQSLSASALATSSISSGSSAPLQLSSRQQASVAPLVRTRGS